MYENISSAFFSLFFRFLSSFFSFLLFFLFFSFFSFLFLSSSPFSSPLASRGSTKRWTKVAPDWTSGRVNITYKVSSRSPRLHHELRVMVVPLLAGAVQPLAVPHSFYQANLDPGDLVSYFSVAKSKLHPRPHFNGASTSHVLENRFHESHSRSNVRFFENEKSLFHRDPCFVSVFSSDLPRTRLFPNT